MHHRLNPTAHPATLHTGPSIRTRQRPLQASISIDHRESRLLAMAHPPAARAAAAVGLAVLEPELLVHALLFVDHTEAIQTGKV